jgi:DNA-binding PadR family transcriptional regulator
MAEYSDSMDRQLLLLGLLRRQQMHGYQINEFIDAQIAFCVELKRSTAYYLLDRLCRDGYVAEATTRAGNRPERRVYSITPAGEARFQELLRHNLAYYTPPTYPEDVGVIFQGELPADEALRLLELRRELVAAQQARLEALSALLPGSHQAVIEHHLVHIAAELSWIDRLLAARRAAMAGRS